MAVLKIERGGGAGTSFFVENEATLGRDSSQATIGISDQKASRVHARIFKEKNTYYLEDLQSKNGTFLNGKPVTAKQALEPGDYIRIGFTWISFGEDLEIERIGKELPSYEILQEISIGGTGLCFKVRQLGLDRIVTLDLLPPTIIRTNPQLKERFRLQARSLAKLNHENIAVMLDFEANESYLFFTTEYIEGETLSSFFAREKKVSVEKVLEIGIGIARGLAHAHSQQVIHQDVTPNNVILYGRRVILKGFGMASILYEVQEGFSGLIGRTEYLSPEQIQKRSPDHRSDMYSMGVILYELLAGKPPFSGENPEEIAKKIVENEPDAIISHASNVPSELEKIIYQCLEKEPEQRFQSCEEVANKLDDILTRQRVLALKESPCVYSSATLYFMVQLLSNPWFVYLFFPVLSIIFVAILAAMVRK